MIDAESALPMPGELSRPAAEEELELVAPILGVTTEATPTEITPAPNEELGEGLRERASIRLLKASVITYEMMPLDDVARYGLLAASQQYSHNPALGAAVLGVSTLATEASAVLAASRWIAEDRIGSKLNVVRERIDSFKETLNRLVPKIRPGRIIPNIPKDPEEPGEKLSATTQAAVALNLGSVVLLEAMQRRDPSRTFEQNRHDGLRTAAWVSGYMSVEGALLSTGYNNLTNPTYVGPAVLGIAALHYGVHKLRQRTRRGE
jgi:hypothetical protein